MECVGLLRLNSGLVSNVLRERHPDGKLLVLRAADAEVFEASDIWLMNADGSGKTNLTQNKQSNWGASWAPDGKHILSNSAHDGRPQLYLINPDWSGLRRLCPH